VIRESGLTINELELNSVDYVLERSLQDMYCGREVAAIKQAIEEEERALWQKFTDCIRSKSINVMSVG